MAKKKTVITLTLEITGEDVDIGKQVSRFIDSLSDAGHGVIHDHLDSETQDDDEDEEELGGW